MPAWQETDSRITEWQIGEIKKRPAELGPMHPGSLGEQYNVCDTGPANARTLRNQVSTGRIINWVIREEARASRLSSDRRGGTEMRCKVENYKRFRELVNQWVDLALALERPERITAMQKDKRSATR